MSVESLPYTLLLLLGQFSAGVAAMLLFAQLRGGFEPGFLRISSWLTVTGAALTTVTALAIDANTRQAEAYAIDPDSMSPIRGVALALLLFSLVYAYFLREDDETFLSHATGATCVGLGAVLLVLMASLVRLPAWSVAGPALTLFAGSLTLGAFSVAMIWGHWYLVNPRLEAGPLNLLVLVAMAAIGLELAITTLNAIIPVGHPFDSSALLAVDLPQNPAFWLRIGIGIVFPGALAFMAYKSSQEHSMMSATGLLYIAVGAVLAGEALGRGLLFVTGAPV